MLVIIAFLLIDIVQSGDRIKKLSDKEYSLQHKYDSLRYLKTPDTVYLSGSYDKGYQDGYKAGEDDGFNEGLDKAEEYSDE